MPNINVNGEIQQINVELKSSNNSVQMGTSTFYTTLVKNYESLENKPEINSHVLIGDQSSDDLDLQDKLVSGQNIKTINNQDILGSGNLTINTSKIYWCNPNLTTYMDVNEALQNGLIPVVKYYDNTYGEVILYYTCSDTNEYYDSVYKFSTTKDSKIFTVSVTRDNWSALSIYETKDITVILYGSQDSLLWMNLDLSKPVVLMTALTHELFNISNYDGSNENATFVYIDDTGILHVASVDWSDHSSVSYSTSTIALQEKLVSGTNIKTINSTSLLGSGNISITPSQIFWCAKDSTTYMEVNQALQNGKIPVVKYWDNTYGDVILIYACYDVDEYSNGIYKFSTSKDSKILTVSLNSYYDEWSSLSVHETKDLNIISYNSQDSLLWMNLDLSKPTLVIRSSTNEFFNLSNYNDSTEKATCVYIDGNKTLHSLLVDWSDHSTVDYTITTQNLQDELISGTNIKSINLNSLLGSGNLDIHEIPAGGNAGQVLSKNSATDYDVHWTNQTVTYPSGYCTTSGSNQKKVINCTLWTATANTYLHILIAQANSYAGEIRFNVNSTGDVPVYINGTISSATNYSLPAGTYIVFYDGTYFYLRTDGVIPNTQETLVSGTNIKTINNTSLLGSGNIDTVELFECTYGTTTYAEITQAISDGKLPYCDYNGYRYFYSGIYNSYHYLRGITSSTSISYVRCYSGNNAWTTAGSAIQTVANKVNSISSASTDTQYPSAKCVYNAIQNAGGSSLTNETVTLLANAWTSSGSGYTQTVTTTNDPDSKSTIWVSPKTDGAIDYMSDYTSNGIYCKSSGNLSLTFYASSVPSQDIVVNVTMG